MDTPIGYLTDIRLYGCTYEVYQFFGALFIRDKYVQGSWMTGKALPRETIEVHPQSSIGQLIHMKLNPDHDSVMGLLGQLVTLTEAGKSLGVAS